jgi:hypothetical protein
MEEYFKQNLVKPRMTMGVLNIAIPLIKDITTTSKQICPLPLAIAAVIV